MNPLVMWLRGHPAERLALGIVCLVAVGMAWELWVHRGDPALSAQPAATSSPPAGQLASRGPTFGTAPAPEELARATGVARLFLEALETYRYDDQPTTQAQRVRPYISDALYVTSFSQPGNSHSTRPDLHETDTPTMTSLSPEGYAADSQLGFLARVTVTRQTDQEKSIATHSYELFMLPQNGGWLVNDFKIGASS
jgi:hypothetical protein